MEVETQILIAQRLDYINAKDVEELMDQCGEVGRLINGLCGSLSKKAMAAD